MRAETWRSLTEDVDPFERGKHLVRKKPLWQGSVVEFLVLALLATGLVFAEVVHGGGWRWSLQGALLEFARRE